MSDAERPPLLRVVKGDPTPEELAALVAVVAARASAAPRPAAPPRRRWTAPHLTLRRPITAGPDGWRGSRWTIGGLP